MSKFRAEDFSFIDAIKDIISTTDPIVLGGVLVAIFIILFTTIYLIVRGRSASRQAVLLVGLCDAGKSLIFSMLIHGKYIATQTSMVENSGTYTGSSDKKAALKLVDIPGHERVRQQYFDKVKATARGIIFVIDSLTFQKEIKDVAELLYQVLSDKVIVKNAVTVLIACNKSDQGLAKGSRLIQSALEKELNNVRKTHSAALQATDGAVATSFIGRRDRDFAFADLRPIHVEFVECSARGQPDVADCKLNDVKDWLAKIA